MVDQLHIYEDEFKPHHECFVAAISDPTGNALELVSQLGLFMKKRANIGAGVSWIPTQGEYINTEKASVTPDIFFRGFDSTRYAKKAIAHGRYRTHGVLQERTSDVHPFHVRTPDGFEFSYAMNGNCTNGHILQERLTSMGLHLPQDLTDSRTNAIYLAHMEGNGTMAKLLRGFPDIEGSHSDVVIAEDGIFGIRDSKGNHPLFLGRNESGLAGFASESAALKKIGMTDLKSMEPGTIMQITNDGDVVVQRYTDSTIQAYCSLETVYFAHKDSISSDGERLNYEVRYGLGYRAGELEKKRPTYKERFVTALPETGLAAGRGFADALGLPFIELYDLITDARSFTQETSKQLEIAATKISLNKNALAEILRMGAKENGIYISDDSTIRGNMLKVRSSELAQHGISEVHARPASDIFGYGCEWGIAMHESQMIYRKCGNNPELIAKALGLSTIAFLPYEEELRVMKGDAFDAEYAAAMAAIKNNYENSGAIIDYETMKIVALASLGLCFRCRAEGKITSEKIDLFHRGAPNKFNSPALLELVTPF